jgi:hypothetical protein
MRTGQLHVRWVLVLVMVAWATELASPPAPTLTTETAISLPAHPSSIAGTVASVPSADFAGAPIHMDTCFEREPEYWAGIPVLTDDYALDGDFAAGVDGSAIILALYQQHQGKIWDYAERCNTAEYYKNAKAVKKLRTVSMAGPDSDWRGGGPFGGGPGGGGPGGGGKNGGIGPSSFGYAPPGGGIFSFGGGGGGSGGGTGGGPGGGGGSDEDPGKQLVGDTKPSDDGKTPPDDKDNTGPGHDNPTNPGGGGTGDPTVLPEPGTLALFLGLAAGFGVMRRRGSRA